MRKSIAPEQIARAILILCGQRVLQDSELASLYGVSTKRFNQQVHRNRKRFPADFMFQLTTEETSSLRSQIATLKTGCGQHRKYLPYVFTEHGAIMAATILNSTRAVEMSVYVVRAFVQLREMLASNRELARRFAQLETRLDEKLIIHDEAFAAILSAIRQLMHPPRPGNAGLSASPRIFRGHGGTRMTTGAACHPALTPRCCPQSCVSHRPFSDIGASLELTVYMCKAGSAVSSILALSSATARGSPGTNGGRFKLRGSRWRHHSTTSACRPSCRP